MRLSHTMLGVLVATGLATAAFGQPPEYIHYTFDAGFPGQVLNQAAPGSGTLMATLGSTLAFTPGTMCAAGPTAIQSSVQSLTTQIDTGWDMSNIGTGDWTVGCWLDLTVGGGFPNYFQYIFGNLSAASFRAFVDGLPGNGNCTLGGSGAMAQVIITGGGSQTAPVHLAWVYDSSVPEIRGYLNGLLNVTVPQVPLNISGTANFFVGGNNVSTSSMRPAVLMDDFRFYGRAITQAELTNWVACFGQATGPPLYDTNDASNSLDIDGVPGTAHFKAIVNRTAFLCTPPVPATFAVNFSSSVGPVGAFETLASFGPVVGGYNGGLAIPTGEILNLSFAYPLLFLNGGLLPRFDPVPPIPVSVTINRTTPLDVAIQSVVTDPAAAVGFTLSQPTELHVDVSQAALSVPGPTGDNNSVSIDLTAGPTCWAPGGISFYTSSYTTIHVSSNGRVVFGGVDDSSAPTIVSAQTNNPFVGYWTNLNPASGGTIAIQNPQTGIIRVDFANVAYFNQAGSQNSFYIEFDSLSGTIELGGLGGIATSSLAAFLGMSPGQVGGATDPGQLNFSPLGPQGGVGAAAATTDMLYDFGTSTLSSFTSGLSSIIFVPSGGNYQWASF